MEQFLVDTIIEAFTNGEADPVGVFAQRGEQPAQRCGQRSGGNGDEPSSLYAQLLAYIDAATSNILQHSEQWYQARKLTIGGSLMAAIQGISPFTTRQQLIEGKTIGASDRISSLAMNMGTVFEDVLRKYIEHTLKTKILADNAFIRGPPETHTSYSPDGIGVVCAQELARYGISVDTLRGGIVSHGTGAGAAAPSTDNIAVDAAAGAPSTNDVATDAARAESPAASAKPDARARDHHVVLFEFKCLHSRKPTSEPPPYYVSQVKTGLDIIPIADYGLLIEAVFRRCAWQDMGLNPKFEKTLTKTASGGGAPLAMGIIGFSTRQSEFSDHLHALRMAGASANASALETAYAQFEQSYLNEYENCDRIYDLALSSRELFTQLLECGVNRAVDIWVGDIVYVSDAQTDAECRRRLNALLAKYREYSAGATNFGILPWKLFDVRAHVIQRTQNYIAQWQNEINEVVRLATQYHSLPESERNRFYMEHIYEPPKYNIIE
jgi:hypothetical protein